MPDHPPAAGTWQAATIAIFDYYLETGHTFAAAMAATRRLMPALRAAADHEHCAEIGQCWSEKPC